MKSVVSLIFRYKSEER